MLGWSVLSMKIISYNVRGLGGFENKNEVKKLVLDKKKTFVLCLQDEIMYGR